jgi:hypothetical protein
MKKLRPANALRDVYSTQTEWKYAIAKETQLKASQQTRKNEIFLLQFFLGPKLEM